MKINIQFSFKEGAWGGGNQFLKCLKKNLSLKEVYTNSPKEADAIIFNSHHELGKIIKLKRRYPDKFFLHRIDGPVNLIRGKDEGVDKKIYTISEKIADAVIFQSKWSKKRNHENGMSLPKNCFVIYNAPDSKIFFPKKEKRIGGKVKLIASSWSSNRRKGFGFYQFLDRNLDFERYEMMFVGNSPIEFKNIKSIPAVKSTELAEKLRSSDIYITASEKDPCSNCLIEALSCGLPAVALNDGGHPELVGGGGVVFDDMNGMIKAIEKVSSNYEKHVKDLPIFSDEKVAVEYIQIAKSLKGKTTKRLSLIDFLKLFLKR